MLEDDLKYLGLTMGESKVYLALLETGVSTVGPVAKKSSVSYSKIYEVLQRLMEKGLVSVIIKQKTRHYQAVEPSRILEFIEKQEEELNERKKKFEEILPRLKRALDTPVTHEAEMFIGLKGLKTAYDLLLKEHNKNEVIYFMYVFDEKSANPELDKFYGSLPYYKKFKWRGLSNSGYKINQFTRKMHKQIEFRITKSPLPTTIDITNDKVLQISCSGNPVAILIHSKEIASKYRIYFEKEWEKSNPI